MGAKRFQDLVAWQLARELRRTIRRLVEAPRIARDFDFKNQLTAAARSTTSNIAEGFPCSHAEFARFLEIASRSLREIEDRLIEAIDDTFMTPDEADKALTLTKRTTTAVSRLMAYLLRTPDPPTYKPRPSRRPRRRR
jgi:four helix bundle protein